jgi:hypothetical protein
MQAVSGARRGRYAPGSPPAGPGGTRAGRRDGRRRRPGAATGARRLRATATTVLGGGGHCNYNYDSGTPASVPGRAPVNVRVQYTSRSLRRGGRPVARQGTSHVAGWQSFRAAICRPGGHSQAERPVGPRYTSARAARRLAGGQSRAGVRGRSREPAEGRPATPSSAEFALRGGCVRGDARVSSAGVSLLTPPVGRSPDTPRQSRGAPAARRCGGFPR